MRVIICEEPSELGALGADLVLERVTSGSLQVLGVATGSSPLPIYRSLAERWVPGLSAVTAFALDEYVGLSHDHPESYHAVIRREVTEPLRLDPSRVHVPDGLADNLDDAAASYEAAIREAGGVDLQLLGIGSTGHIGFNEPMSSLSSRTRPTTLAPQTRADNARFFPRAEDVPMHCVTQGLGTILEARQILLVAHGNAKAGAIARAIEGPLSSACPASVLQLHDNVTVVLDRAAASRLQFIDYYEFLAAHPVGA